MSELSTQCVKGSGLKCCLFPSTFLTWKHWCYCTALRLCANPLLLGGMLLTQGVSFQKLLSALFTVDWFAKRSGCLEALHFLPAEAKSTENMQTGCTSMLEMTENTWCKAVILICCSFPLIETYAFGEPSWLMIGSIEDSGFCLIIGSL